MRNLRSRLPGHSTVAAYLALFVALTTGGAYAADQLLDKNDVTSKHIKDAGVKTKDLADNAVTSPKVANGSLLGEDFAAGQLPGGEPGPAGPPGPPGSDGSPDTAQQVLDKLKTVDGTGSGLDADSVDGVDGSGLTRTITNFASGQTTSNFLAPAFLDVPGLGRVNARCKVEASALTGELLWENTSSSSQTVAVRHRNDPVTYADVPAGGKSVLGVTGGVQRSYVNATVFQAGPSRSASLSLAMAPGGSVDVVWCNFFGQATFG